MPGRLEELTRAGTPRRAQQSIGDRGPNGRRRIGCRVRPLHPTRQAKGPHVAPSPKAIRRTHRFCGAMRQNLPNQAPGTLQAHTATDPATPCGQETVALVTELVKRFAAGFSQQKQSNMVGAVADRRIRTTRALIHPLSPYPSVQNGRTTSVFRPVCGRSDNATGLSTPRRGRCPCGQCRQPYPRPAY